MFLLTKFVSWGGRLNFASVTNQLQLFIKKAICSVFIVGVAALSWQTTVRAKTVDVGTLVPIINFILEDEFQCPSIEQPSIVIEDGIVISFENAPLDSGIQRQGLIMVSTQEDLDELDGVIRIDGDILFNTKGLLQELDLSPLDSLVEVTGSVFISTGNTQISGFNCLKSVGADLSILDNSNLENINGFESLEVVAGSFVVSSNGVLNGISGFSLLESVGVDLSLVGNVSLQTVNGFNVLESVGRSFQVIFNPVLESAGDFQVLTSIGRDFLVIDNASLGGINGFQSLGSIGNNFFIIDNGQLNGVGGFSVLQAVGGDLNVQGNSSLESIGSLGSLERSDVDGNILIIENTLFDCGNPLPNFLPVTFSSGNVVNCPQSSALQAIPIFNDEAMPIPDSGSVSSSITIPVESGINGLVGSLEVNLDITHPSVGDLTVTLSDGTTTINLLAEPTTLMSNDPSLGDMANECINDTFPTDDFLDNEINGGSLITLTPDGEVFNSFPTFDVDCITNLIASLGEGDGTAQACSSNDISVNLIDDLFLLPINTSCSSDDTADAFPLPPYNPLEALSAFEGSDVNQTWTLTVTDSKDENVGVLNSWGIVIDLQP